MYRIVIKRGEDARAVVALRHGRADSPLPRGPKVVATGYMHKIIPMHGYFGSSGQSKFKVSISARDFF